jgi:NADPH:quinone reductase
MQAMTSSSHKTPLSWAEIPSRPLRRDEVRVSVRAVGVNPVDWKMRQGDMLGILQRLIGPRGPLVCGVDFAGEVSAVGEAVKDITVGARVVGGTDFSRGQYGSYAREVQVRADQVALLPPNVDYAEAAALPVAGVTALTALLALGHLDKKPDAKALILGASGGVGHFAIQLAKIYGALAVGTCSTRNAALVESLGGTPIDYSQGESFIAAESLGLYDVIVDCVGTSSYPAAKYKKLLKAKGRHVMVVPGARDYWRVAVPGPTVTVLGRPNRANLTPLVEHLSAGTLKVIIEKRFDLAQAEEAHQASKAGKVVGKLVLIA